MRTGCARTNCWPRSGDADSGHDSDDTSRPASSCRRRRRRRVSGGGRAGRGSPRGSRRGGSTAARAGWSVPRWRSRPRRCAEVPTGLAALGRVPLRGRRRSRAGPRGCPPRLAAAVGRHVEQGEGPVDRLVATTRRGVGEEHAIAVAQETDDVPHSSADRRVHTAHRVPGLGVAHELDIGGHLVPRARGHDGERDAAGVEIDGVLHMPGRGGAALALPLVRRAVVPRCR